MEFISKIPIHKGWSEDLKYCVTTADGGRYLLRVSALERSERKAREARRMGEVAALGIPMCQPIRFGICEGGVYSLQSWIDGEDARDVMPTLLPGRQYAYGLDAGRILAKIHTIPAPADLPSWEVRFNAKIDRKIMAYEACDLKYQGGEAFLDYISANRHLLSSRPQSYQHGDYHIGNMMIDRNGVLTIIDFDRDDYGDLGRNLTASFGVPRRLPRLPGAWWMVISAENHLWGIGVCWRYTSAPIRSAV